jgi:hypothetical protein
MPLRPLTQTEESDNGLDLNGFTLQFTDGKTYDLDEIIFNRRRDNSKAPIAIKVNSTEYVEAEVLQQLTAYILLKYPTASSTADIPNFQDVLNLYFEREYENFSEAAKIAKEEGELVVDQKQEKLRVKKDDIKNYLLGKERTRTAAAPAVNYNRALAVITQGTPDGNILDLDGGEFVPTFEDLDGGDFDSELDDTEEGGGF